MRKVINEKALRNMIKAHIAEAMKYNKERGQYFPDYTGKVHSDAGKYTAKNKDDYDWSRNQYDWSNSNKQRRFNDLQNKNDFGVDPFDMPDEESEENAQSYLYNKEGYHQVDRAVDYFTPNLFSMVDNLYQQAVKKFPALSNEDFKRDFIDGLRRELESY